MAEKTQADYDAHARYLSDKALYLLAQHAPIPAEIDYVDYDKSFEKVVSFELPNTKYGKHNTRLTIYLQPYRTGTADIRNQDGSKAHYVFERYAVQIDDANTHLLGNLELREAIKHVVGFSIQYTLEAVRGE